MDSSLPRLAHILDVRHEALVMVRHVADHLHPSVWQVHRVLALETGGKKAASRDLLHFGPLRRDEIANGAIFLNRKPRVFSAVIHLQSKLTGAQRIFLNIVYRKEPFSNIF
jgi:hypothetical protein